MANLSTFDNLRNNQILLERIYLHFERIIPDSDAIRRGKMD